MNSAFDTSMPHSFDAEYIIGYVKAHVEVNGRGCWIFTGPRGGTSPYPTMMINRVEYHVIDLMLKAVGRTNKLLKGTKWQHCHTCDDGRCVNPDHIFIGTAKDNTQDAVKKGRHFSAKIKARTTCVNGHPFDEKNTWMFRGARWCKTCLRERQRRRLKIPKSNHTFENNERVAKITSELVIETVRQCNGNKKEAARRLNITPWTLYDRWHAAGLSVRPTRPM